MSKQGGKRQLYSPGHDLEGGFTIIEVMIAMLVFAIGILGVVTMQTSSVSGNAKARYISEATNFAAERMEILLNTNYSTIVDGRGTNPAINGLDDIDTATTKADGHYSPNNLYSINWNVVDNLPASNSKTIKVLVTSKLLSAPVTIIFVKDAGI